ncbi:hypothetical protein GQ42DRAFT_42148 [Ramicandelaber brevisporus]|nr:hypothetical protein GQ42DRAFT_42148 [Ramicandelaber brevisporus]
MVDAADEGTRLCMCMCVCVYVCMCVCFFCQLIFVNRSRFAQLPKSIPRVLGQLSERSN